MNTTNDGSEPNSATLGAKFPDYAEQLQQYAIPPLLGFNQARIANTSASTTLFQLPSSRDLVMTHSYKPERFDKRSRQHCPIDARPRPASFSPIASKRR